MNFFNISEQLHGRWCRFIIHRYLGHLLEKDLSLDQLSIDLSRGCVKIEQVMLNVEYINEQMAALNLPLRLVDGFIGRINIRVPWTSLMADASEVDLSDVQLTFRGTETFNWDDKDLVSSMLDSIVGSLVSSMDLAQSFSQEENEEGTDDESVNALSKVLDAVVSRFCANIDGLILRVESDGPANCDTAIAVELKVEKLRFMDEQMRQCRQEGTSAEEISSQSHGLSSATNLNKYITLDGISLFTDTFSKTDQTDDYGPLVTSMSIRREQRTNLENAGSQHASMYNSIAESMSGAYQSIQSNVSQSLDEFKSIRNEPTLLSNPVKFAEIAGETTIVIRIKNSDGKEKEKFDSKFEFDIYSKGIALLVSPSQIELIKNLTGLFIPVEKKPMGKKISAGEPMTNRDFDIVNRRLDDMTASYVPTGRNALSRDGNWQGVEDCTFQSISLKEEWKQKTPTNRKEQEKANKEENKRETSMISLKIGTVFALLTHDDPLSVDSVAERGQRDAVEMLHANSKRFFEKAAELNIYAMPISRMQKAADELYLKDHIRLIGSTVSVSYSVEGTRVSTKLSIANCDVSEFLAAESTVTGIARHNPLLAFDREDGDQGSQFTVVIKRDATSTSTVIHLGKCRSELDMSIADRVSALLCPVPFFTVPTRAFETTPSPSHLSSDLFSEARTKEATTSSIEVNCVNWIIDIKIPKVDLRQNSVNRISHTVQNVHDEFLRLKLTSAKVLIPSKKSNEPQTVEITASSITGHFMGDLEKMGCAEEETAFLYAGSKVKPVRIALEFDGSNKSLKATNSGLIPMNIDLMAKSLSADIIKNRPKKEGPFAQTHQSFTKSNAANDDHEEIIRAGSREEMAVFARECMEQSDITLRVDFPLLRLLIPNHQYLELLYNRLVNDFALWQPSAPVFKANNPLLNINFDDFKEVKSAMVYGQTHVDSDDDEEDANDYSRTERENNTLKARSHLFALNLEVLSGTMVMGTEIAPTSETETGQPAQVVAELGGTQLFVCSGFHGDPNQTFVHVTSTNVTVAQRNSPTIPKNVLNRNFGSYDKSEVHLRSLASDSHLREERRDDSLAIALHLVTSEDGRVKETTAAIALRLLELNLIPVKRMEECWFMQLKDLFCLVDFEIPGYEMPICNTYLHINLDHAVLAHDHNRIVEGSPLKYKLVLGNVDISSTLVPSMRVNKFLFLFERIHLHMMKEEEEERTVQFEDEPRVKGSNMVHILEIGLFQLELLIFNQLMAREGEKRNCPLFELRCQNDQIKAWVCHDSLVTLINSMVEVSNLFKEEPDDCSLDKERSVSSASTRSTVMRNLIDSACKGESAPSSPSPSEERDVGYGREAELAAKDDSFDNNLLEDAMRDTSLGPDEEQPYTFSTTDDEFCMVEDIPGCGITSLSGEPRIRLVDPDNTTEAGEYFYNYVPEHLPPSGDFRSDCIPLPADYPVPLIRYNLKDISIQLYIFGGNDLGPSSSTTKSYSAFEYRDGSGRGQSIAREERGGPGRDHSVSVVVELAKISVLHQLFDEEASVRSMNFVSIQDVTVHDRLTLSSIKEMLYQYATTEHPRRTCAPMIAVRMVENHSNEGKLRVSMLPIRVNVDQDTLEFLEDFVQTVSSGLALPETAKLQLSIDVPERIDSRDSSLNPRPVSPADRSSSSSSPLPSSPTRSIPVMEDMLAPQRGLDDLDDFNGLTPSAPPLSLTNTSSIESRASPTASHQMDDLLSRSTMEGSLYGGGLGERIEDVDDDDDDKPITDEPFFSTEDRFKLDTSASNEDDEGEEEEDRETFRNETPRRMSSSSQSEEKMSGTTFFKEFAFAPDCPIYIDYHGKNKYNMDKGGAVLGVLRGIGQLNKTEINLKSFEHRNGLLGMERCATHALTEWQEAIMANLPGVLSSVGPISPLVQIGKGIYDFFSMPVSEMQKEDGHVVKGLQRGTSSFGFSTAAAVVDLAQRLVGVVQLTAESVLFEMTPDHPALNNRNRRPVTQRVRAPQDVRHGMQLAYDLIANGVEETRVDLELATQEDRASGRSSMRSLLRYAPPAILRPFVITTQIGYHLLGGLKNQLRPDEFQDEQHKWRQERDRAGTTGGN